MAATVKKGVLQAFEIIKEEEIAAPIEIVFETILEQMGPLNSTPKSQCRWCWRRGREDGGIATWATTPATSGVRCRPSRRRHCWRSAGPLFMSTPAVSNLQYRLTEENGATRMRFVHRAMGWVGEHERGVDDGWSQMIGRIRTAAAERARR